MSPLIPEKFIQKKNTVRSFTQHKMGSLLFTKDYPGAMKVLKWIAYIFALIGAILILAGLISGLTNKHNLQYVYTASYFLAGNSFLLITIVIFFFIHLDHHKKK